MRRSKRIIVVLLTIVMSATVFLACKRSISNDEILGPGLVSAPADFTGLLSAPVLKRMNRFGVVTTISPTTSLFFGTLNSYGIEADLSHEVSWTITFEGVTSTAEVIRKGTGNKINLLADSLQWTGESDNFRFFMDGEDVLYTISFLGSAIEYSNTLKIATTKGYNELIVYRANQAPLEYYMVDNFDGNYGILPMQTAYADAADGVDKVAIFTTNNIQVDGVVSYYAKGTDASKNNYLGGASHESLIEMWRRIKETDPSKVFVNAYIYGYDKPNSSVFLQLYESDNNDPLNPSDIPTSWVGNANDMWYSIVQVNWKGWKLVSIPYSAFKPANNPNSGGNGNRIQEPHKLSGCGIEIESFPTPGFPVELSMDLMTITVNGPFVP